MSSYQIDREGLPTGPDGRHTVAETPGSGPIGNIRANAHPDGWDPPRDAKPAREYPRTQGVSDGYPLGKTNEQRAQDARDRNQ